MTEATTEQPAYPSLDVPDIGPLLDDLEENVDNLEVALQPLLEHALSDTASKLPVLDRAKLYTLTAYTIESILFCMLMNLYPLTARQLYNVLL